MLLADIRNGSYAIHFDLNCSSSETKKNQICFTWFIWPLFLDAFSFVFFDFNFSVGNRCIGFHFFFFLARSYLQRNLTVIYSYAIIRWNEFESHNNRQGGQGEKRWWRTVIKKANNLHSFLRCQLSPVKPFNQLIALRTMCFCFSSLVLGRALEIRIHSNKNTMWLGHCR